MKFHASDISVVAFSRASLLSRALLRGWRSCCLLQYFLEQLGPPVVPFTLFFGRVPLLKYTTKESWYPDSSLSNGGPRQYAS